MVEVSAHEEPGGSHQLQRLVVDASAQEGPCVDSRLQRCVMVTCVNHQPQRSAVTVSEHESPTSSRRALSSGAALSAAVCVCVDPPANRSRLTSIEIGTCACAVRGERASPY